MIDTTPGLFDPFDPDPKNDAAPSGNGASAKGDETHARLYTRIKPRASHNAPPGTSEVAAAMIAGHTKTQRADLFRLLVEAGERGMTDSEMESASGLRASSISPRRGELRTLGLIVDTGLRRPTPRGRPAAVWIATTLGGTPPTMPGGASHAAGGSKGGAA